jgi:hypothetical protein
VYNNYVSELAYEQGRRERRARGEQVSPTRKKKSSTERIANLERKMGESMARLNAQRQKSVARNTAKLAKIEAAKKNKEKLNAYLVQRKADVKK